jgi:integrase
VHYLGYFCRLRERDRAREAKRVEFEAGGGGGGPWTGVTVGDYAETFLARYRAEHKASSYATVRRALTRFVADFGDRPLAGLARAECREWAERVPASRIPAAVTMLSQAVDDELLERNPLRGTARSSKGRSDEAPPTPDEFERLLDGCDALGGYAPQMRALLVFGAHTAMRPGELFALRWRDVDVAANRVHVRRRVYLGKLDVPKSGEARTIAMPPPARDVVMRQPTRHQELVFLSMTGAMLSQPTLYSYWKRVKARAGSTRSSTWQRSTTRCMRCTSSGCRRGR